MTFSEASVPQQFSRILQKNEISQTYLCTTRFSVACFPFVVRY